jgi:hypothetical protein
MAADKAHEPPNAQQLRHPPGVEVIEMLATPHNDHLSLALHLVSQASESGACGRTNIIGVLGSNLSMSSMIHAWAAIEGAVNLTIYHRLKNKGHAGFIQPKDRSAHDKRIADKFQKELPFEERLTYLADSKKCCSVISNLVGRIRQFERLRNELLHGYIVRQEVLLERQDGTTTEKPGPDGTVISSTTYLTRDRVVQMPDGHSKEVSALVEKYEQLGLQHDVTELCRHDALKCILLSLDVLAWLDGHFGVCTNAAWILLGTQRNYATRRFDGITTSATICGKDEFMNYVKELDALAKSGSATRLGSMLR